MTQTFATNEKNDLYIGLDGRLVVVSGIDAVLNACQTAAQAQLGEMVLAVDQGVPNFETIWTSSANVAQFEAYVKRAIMSVDGVKGIENFSVKVQNNKVIYNARIQTIYGTGEING